MSDLYNSKWESKEKAMSFDASNRESPDELKPCPCGKPAQYFQCAFGKWSVHCSKGDCFSLEGEHRTKEQARNDWNGRIETILTAERFDFALSVIQGDPSDKAKYAYFNDPFVHALVCFIRDALPLESDRVRDLETKIETWKGAHKLTKIELLEALDKIAILQSKIARAIEELKSVNDVQPVYATVAYEKILNSIEILEAKEYTNNVKREFEIEKFKFIEKFADNGEHSHWSAVEIKTGKIILEDCQLDLARKVFEKHISNTWQNGDGTPYILPADLTKSPNGMIDNWYGDEESGFEWSGFCASWVYLKSEGK